MAAVDKFTRTTEILWTKRDGHGHCVSEREGERAREPGPLPGPAFIASLGTLCGGWSSLTMHRFTGSL